MRIIFFGTPKEVVPILENLDKHFSVVAAVTAPDQKSGRKQIITPSPVKNYAQAHTIPVITLQQFTDEIIGQIQSFKPDLFVVAAYGKLIPNGILKLAKLGSINIHPSLLPKYRGPTPIQTTLLNGDQTSGVTFIKMDEHMDHGPILQQIPFTIEKTDTFGWLMQSTFSQAAQILPSIIEDYTSDNIKPQPQDEKQATYTKILSKRDGYIDLNHPPEKEILDHMIRAYYPWPTVWTTIKIKNQEVRIKLLPKNMLQVEGKSPVSLKDFLNGYPEMIAIMKIFDH